MNNELPEFIVVEQTPLTLGRSPRVNVRLKRTSVSGSHATIQRAGDGLLIEDHDSAFGTFVNGVRIRKASLRFGDLVTLGTSPHFSLIKSTNPPPRS